MVNGAGDGVRRADVETLHAILRTITTGGNANAGERFNQLLFAARRIARGHGKHLHVCLPGAGGFHGGERFGLVVFNADANFCRARQLRQNLCAAHDGGGAFAHQALVAGNPRFAFGAVQDQRVNLMPVAQLDVTGKGRAAQPHDAAVAQMAQGGLARGALQVKRRVRCPFFLAVRHDVCAQAFAAVGLRQRMRRDGAHLARGGRVHGSAEGIGRFGQFLPFEYALARAHHYPPGRAPFFLQGHEKLRGQRRGGNCRLARGGFVRLGVNAAGEGIRCRLHQAFSCFSAKTGYGHGRAAGTACIWMHSTGQGDMHSSQPVHNCGTTACNCLAAPAMASTGQA